MSCSVMRSVRLLQYGLITLAALATVVSTSHAQTNAPIIIEQPRGGTTALGESWEFSVDVLGTSPVLYRWIHNNQEISGATNSIYFIPMITNSSSGTYSVVVANAAGETSSATATLTISESPPRVVRNGNITSGNVVRIPMLFSGNGQESTVSFSLKFDPSVLTNPGWENRGTNDITGTNAVFLNLSEATNGLVGLRVGRPGNFPPRTYELGNFTFDRVTTNDPFAAMLQFTNTPTQSEALTISSLSMGMQGAVIPQIDLIDATPLLDRQSGLMQQLLTISYPGSLTITNIDIAAGNLGKDSLDNNVTLFNRIGVKSVPVDPYGNEEVLPFASAGEFGPATQKLLTMEYYVADKFTAPQPTYFLDLGDIVNFTIPNAATPLNITTNRYHNGTYVIQFPTIPNYLYYVQYAESVNDLVNYGPTSKFVDPPVVGTGSSVQWVDNGPPKTVSRPTDGMRFYRVIELPVN